MLLLGFLPLAASAARAEPERLIARFDFEETNDAGVQLGSGLTLPRSWAPIGRDPGTGDPAFAQVPIHRELIARGGHPLFNPVGYAPAEGEPGYVLRLATRGGDVGAYLAAGAVPTEAGGVYRVAARLRTRGLDHGSVRVLGCIADTRGRRIPGTLAAAAPAGPADAGGWQAWEVQLEAPAGEDAGDGSVVLEVALLQPRPDPTDPLGDERVLPVETDATLEVDDVEVRRLPRADWTTRQPLQVVELPARPELRLRASDLGVGQLRARLRLRDLDGRVVASEERAIDQEGVLRWRPDLPRLGWYEAEADVVDEQGAVLLSRRLALVHGPEEPAEPRRADAHPRFLLDLSDLPLEPARLLGVAAASGLPGVLLPAWTETLEAEELPARAEALAAAARSLHARSIKLEIALGPRPAAFTSRSPAMGVGVIDPGGFWRPWIEPLVVGVGGRTDGWWLARPAEAEAAPGALFASSPGFSRLVGDWAAGTRVRPVAGFDRLGLAGEAVADTASVLPLPLAPEDPASIAGGWVAVRPEAAAATSRRVQAEAFANTLLDVAAARPDAGFVVGPLVRLHRGEPVATPLLPVARRLSRWTIGFGEATPWRAAEGVEAWVLPGGTLVVRAAAGGPVGAALALGEAPAAVVEDVWGNRWKPAGATASTAEVRVGRSPLRVTGLPPGPLGMRASFGIDRPLLEATPRPQPRVLVLRNPHDAAIRGELRVRTPPGWTVRPTRIPLNLAPGATASLPVELQVAPHAQTGTVLLDAEAVYDLQGPRTVSLRTPLTLGVPGLRLQASVAEAAPRGSGDLLATCVAFNDGDTAAALTVFAQVAGQPYSERLAPQVEPGGFAVFRFRFAGAAEEATRSPVLCGVRRSGNPGALNRHLLLKPAAGRGSERD
ncbi:hypothetical protein PSMK_15350 [Phycisphaera mikurensis NBRC 102666]|uniref:Alpha-galactosidase NEW3 domain-containing protein n=1 Tax=Phycisphaera mikurensis (strain NBRC 102666 / KCTC 22515 / FYK2301M01) TaxID=1142394 RepID=I0IEK6_PHYMF|nr:hypothetical protein PSMK_15350 [Phycisphaera mikurensis NBRC 102666]